MRLLVSFFLTVVIYAAIVFFFLFFIFQKPEPEKKVYVHTAIIAKKAKINSTAVKKQDLKKSTVSKIKKTEKKIKKHGSKSDMTHGGDDIGFNDIFKNVDYNVDTEKIKQKKQLDLSRFKGIERNLKKIKKISVKVNFVQNSKQKLSKEEIDDIISQKLYSIWYDVSQLPVDYAKIEIINENGNVVAKILESNLPEDKQLQLVNEIEKVKFDKNFNITVLFQSKVDEDE